MRVPSNKFKCNIKLFDRVLDLDNSVFIANHHNHGDAVTLQKFADASHFIRKFPTLHCARVVGR